MWFVDVRIRILGMVKFENKQTAQGGGRYAQILMSRVVLKELIVLKGLYHTFESALSDHAENVGGVRLELGWLHYSDPYRLVDWD
jgi:hypothetical protein